MPPTDKVGDRCQTAATELERDTAKPCPNMATGGAPRFEGARSLVESRLGPKARHCWLRPELERLAARWRADQLRQGWLARPALMARPGLAQVAEKSRKACVPARSLETDRPGGRPTMRCETF